MCVWVLCICACMRPRVRSTLHHGVAHTLAGGQGGRASERRAGHLLCMPLSLPSPPSHPPHDLMITRSAGGQGGRAGGHHAGHRRHAGGCHCRGCAQVHGRPLPGGQAGGRVVQRVGGAARFTGWCIRAGCSRLGH